jgi:hypothetical protein
MAFLILGLLFLSVIVVVVLPVILIARGEKAARQIAGVLDRIVVLSSMFLALDLITGAAILVRFIVV